MKSYNWINNGKNPRFLIYKLDMKDVIPFAWWQALLAVVDQGGYARAAESLGKSQSAVSYSIQRLEDRLGLRVFRTEGRRADQEDRAIHRSGGTALARSRYRHTGHDG